MTDIDLKDAEQWLHLRLKDWEKLKDEHWIRLTDAEVKELMNLEIPKRWAFEAADEALRKKHHGATLFQQFGDIPQVRYIVEFHLMSRGGIVTLEFAKQLVADSAAMYFLFPNADNQHTFEYEYYAMFEASDQLRPIVTEVPLRILEKYREARAEGISFYNIDWDHD